MTIAILIQYNLSFRIMVFPLLATATVIPSIAEFLFFNSWFPYYEKPTIEKSPRIAGLDSLLSKENKISLKNQWLHTDYNFSTCVMTHASYIISVGFLFIL